MNSLNELIKKKIVLSECRTKKRKSLA